MHSLFSEALLPSYLLRAALAPNFAVDCLLTTIFTTNSTARPRSTAISETCARHLLVATSHNLFQVFVRKCYLGAGTSHTFPLPRTWKLLRPAIRKTIEGFASVGLC
jgi:hypothetical protein